MHQVLSMIMAGGEGRRLYPLTLARAKPAVPFGGGHRIIDFTLSNFVNSGLFKIFVLTQFKSHSLMKHLRQGWRISGLNDTFIEAIPAQMRTGKRWYEGTADAIYQNLNLIWEANPDLVFIFGGDHIYKMDLRQMIRFHEKKKAELTVAALPVPVHEAHHFGIIEVDADWRMVGFEEKPQKNPKTIPGDDTMVLASMGNYVFNTDTLINQLEGDAAEEKSSHDFGKDIIPKMVESNLVYVYDFSQNKVPGEPLENRGYWRDVGTLDTLWSSHMDLIGISPTFSLYNSKWPIHTYIPPYPPAKFVHASGDRTGHALNSMVAPGSIISGALVEESVIGYNVHIHSYAHVYRSVIMDNVDIGRRCRVQNAIIDKNVILQPGVTIGYDLERDRQRFTVSENGIVVIPKNVTVEP